MELIALERFFIVLPVNAWRWVYCHWLASLEEATWRTEDFMGGKVRLPGTLSKPEAYEPEEVRAPRQISHGSKEASSRDVTSILPKAPDRSRAFEHRAWRRRPAAASLHSRQRKGDADDALPIQGERA